MTSLSFLQSLPSQNHRKLFRSSRFRSNTAKPGYQFYDEDEDKSSEEEFEPAIQRRRSRSGLSLQCHLFLALLVFASTLMVARIMSDAHGVSLCAETTRGLNRATRKFRDRLSSYGLPKFARFWHQDPGKPYVEHDKPSTELTTTEVDTPFDLSRLDPIVLDPSHFEPVDHCKDPEITASQWRALDERIEVAMHRRSMTSQKLPLRNFALEYIPELTSHSDSTLDNRQKRGMNRLNRILGFQLAHTLGHTPNAALIDGGDDDQSCWKFAGSKGYLGIRLQARISIESFTIEHLHRDSLLGLDVLQAPRKVILWGLIEGPIDPSKENLYREYMDSEPVSKIVSQSSFILPSESDKGERLLLLAAFE